MRIAVANQKGGVGKTAITCAIASAAANSGARVLVVDVDPQGNATVTLGAEPNDTGTVAAMTGATPLIETTKWHNVDLVAASLNLARADMDGSHDVPFRLDEALSALDLDGYDVVLLDLPPSVGRLLAAGLVAADYLLMVTDATADGIKGIENITSTYDLVRSRMNPRLGLAGIVINRRRRTTEQRYREDELRAAYGPAVIETTVPERAALPEAHAAALPIHDHTTDGARSIAAAADELWSALQTRTTSNDQETTR